MSTATALSLTETLRRLGYTTRPAGFGRKDILLVGSVWFSGTADEVWQWLRETGQI